MVRKLAGNWLFRDSQMGYTGFSEHKNTPSISPTSTLWKLMLAGAPRQHHQIPRQMLYKYSRYASEKLGECWLKPDEVRLKMGQGRVGRKRARGD